MFPLRHNHRNAQPPPQPPKRPTTPSPLPGEGARPTGGPVRKPIMDAPPTPHYKTGREQWEHSLTLFTYQPGPHPPLAGAGLFPVNHTGTRTPVDCPTTQRCRQATRLISTGPLHPSQGFHARPINPVISWEPYPHPEGRGGRPHLGAGFPLRCFQRLSLPNVANQPCPWRDNWHTRGSSVPVLSY